MASNVVFPLYSCGFQRHTILNIIASASDRLYEPLRDHIQGDTDMNELGGSS